MRNLRVLTIVAVVAVFAGCGNPQSSLGGPNIAPAGSRGASPATGSCCNIFWNKNRLRLPYPTKGHAQAVLTYWAPNGYFTYPIYCQNGGQISATAHRTWGNAQGYMHVVYWFKAKSAGPDRCSFTAVLSDTGSPPFAIIRLRIE
jgi:hypothetical protein